ncbi:hypothetical protein [Nitrosomonas sp. Nm51]|uniref:hypothetical protein n=1 Tax=Nitrosomonas sp. Nm51 TaxID=133720 RepID=UPI000B89A5B7|nr:hypothetical protein [Nitrosomonas sp. Nm51]
MKHRCDESDARYLAHLLRLGLLVAEGYIIPKNRRAMRDLARKRMQLVSNAVPGLLRSNRRCSVIRGARQQKHDRTTD